MIDSLRRPPVSYRHERIPTKHGTHDTDPMQLLDHMTLKNPVDIGRAAYVQAKGKRVKSANKVSGRVATQFFGVDGHLCGLFVGGPHEDFRVVYLDLSRDTSLEPVLNTLDAASLVKLQQFCDLGWAAQTFDEF